jgi:hypothetical protein
LVKAVEEGGSRHPFTEDIPQVLQIVPTAGWLTENSVDPETHEAAIVDGTLSADVSDVVVENVKGWGENHTHEIGIGAGEGE